MLLLRVPSSSSPAKGLYNPKAFITHAASLDQACAHCPRFPTAASRRSLGRVSVPVWLIVLSDQLPIIALVGRYPANQLIGRGPIPGRPPPKRKALATDFRPWRHPVLAAVSRGCPGARGRFPRVTHPSATRCRAEALHPVRLACVRRAASVRSEPGSNSQLHPAPARHRASIQTTPMPQGAPPPPDFSPPPPEARLKASFRNLLSKVTPTGSQRPYSLQDPPLPDARTSSPFIKDRRPRIPSLHPPQCQISKPTPGRPAEGGI